MREEIVDIIRNLEIGEEDVLMAELRHRVLTQCMTERGAKQIIEELKEKETKIDRGGLEKRPFYSLFKACAWYELHELLKAGEFSRDAVTHFRMLGLGSRWNQAMALWILGVTCCDNGCQEEGSTALQDSVKMIKGLSNEYYLKCHADMCRRCNDFLIKRLDWIIASLPHQVKRSAGAISPEGEEIIEAEYSEDYLLLPWLPIYHKVRAGLSGIPVWSDPDKYRHAKSNQVMLDDDRYVVYSLVGTSAKDRQITLTEDKEYGWVKVQGHSMNKTKPIPIENNDYVLFRKYPKAKNGDIVIAPKPVGKDKSEDYLYIIKKFKDKVLYSETTESGEEYKPLPLGKDAQILGVAVAVAKRRRG